MEDRRVALRMQWREVAESAGLSIAGLGAIRRGERRPTAVTRARLEDALQWAPGSVDAVLAGGEPIPLQGVPDDGPAVAVPETYEQQLHEELQQLRDDLARLNPRYRLTKRVVSRALEQEIERVSEQLAALERIRAHNPSRRHTGT